MKKVGLSERKAVRSLFCRPYHGGLKAQIKHLNMSQCEYKNCYVNVARTTPGIIDAEAVLFQGNNIPHITPKRRDSDQVFVFTDIEPPQYLHVTNLNHPKWRHFFNWTMTYRFDSDIPYLYGSVVVNPDLADVTSRNRTKTSWDSVSTTALNSSPS